MSLALRFYLLPFVALALSTPVAAQSAKELISIYRDLNEMCRGGAGNEQATTQACETRNKVSKLLKAKGYCYGKKGQGGYQMDWHRCGPSSLRGAT